MEMQSGRISLKTRIFPGRPISWLFAYQCNNEPLFYSPSIVVFMNALWRKWSLLNVYINIGSSNFVFIKTMNYTLYKDPILKKYYQIRKDIRIVSFLWETYACPELFFMFGFFNTKIGLFDKITVWLTLLLTSSVKLAGCAVPVISFRGCASMPLNWNRSKNSGSM